jgi:hypothetical protein
MKLILKSLFVLFAIFAILNEISTAAAQAEGIQARDFLEDGLSYVAQSGAIVISITLIKFSNFHFHLLFNHFI